MAKFHNNWLFAVAEEKRKNRKNLCDVEIIKVLNTFSPSKVGWSNKTDMVLIKDCHHFASTANILSIFWTKHQKFVVFPINGNSVILHPPPPTPAGKSGELKSFKRGKCLYWAGDLVVGTWYTCQGLRTVAGSEKDKMGRGRREEWKRKED